MCLLFIDIFHFHLSRLLGFLLLVAQLLVLFFGMKRGEVRRELLPRVSSHIYTGSFKKPVVKPINSEKLDGLVNVQSLEEILPESVCLNLCAELSSKLHELAKNCLDVKNEKPPNFVVEVPGFGMVDREGLQEMTKLRKLHQTVREVQEERV